MIRKKRERLQIIYDILLTIRQSNNKARTSRILSTSNLSTHMFHEYIDYLIEKEFITEEMIDDQKYHVLTEKGNMFLNEYKIIEKFMDGFGLKD